MFSGSRRTGAEKLPRALSHGARRCRWRPRRRCGSGWPIAGWTRCISCREAACTSHRGSAVPAIATRGALYMPIFHAAGPFERPPTIKLPAWPEDTQSLSANCSAGLQTGCNGGFQAARCDVCGSGDPHDSRSGERRYDQLNLRIGSYFGTSAKSHKV